MGFCVLNVVVVGTERRRPSCHVCSTYSLLALRRSRYGGVRKRQIWHGYPLGPSDYVLPGSLAKYLVAMATAKYPKWPPLAF